MSSLLPQNRTPLEVALEEVMRPDVSPDLIATLWNPQRCPAAFLPWLAWSLSVDEWRVDWPESVKRAVIQESVSIHRKKGTVWSIKRLLAAVGAQSELREWWQMEPRGTPHTFEIDVYASHLPDTQDDEPILGEVATKRIADLINSTKPVRSHYTLRLGASYLGPLATGGVIGRPSALVAPLVTQRPDRDLFAKTHIQHGAAMSRPATLVSPIAAQQPDRDLRGTLTIQHATTLARPVVAIVARAA